MAVQGDGAHAPQEDQRHTEQVMHQLGDHVPLSLVMDLAAPSGPDSRAILEAEGAPTQQWWVQP